MTNDNDVNVNDSEIETWQNIIAKLCTHATSNTVRDCLRSYDASKPSRDISKTLNNFSKDKLLETLEFLTKKEVSKKFKKSLVIDALIMKVKNYFPDICQICHKSYTIEIHDDPFLACNSCGQEVHKPCYMKLLASMNLLDDEGSVTNLIFNIPGINYLCAACEKDTVSEFCDDPSNIDNNKDKLDKQKSEIDSQEEYSDVQMQKKEIKKDAKIKERTKEETVCKYYTKGYCKHGIKGTGCKFRHPKACKKLLLHGNKKPKGCNEGKNCDHFHPRMCSNSIKKGECFDKDCKFVHVKGTKRKENKSSTGDRDKSTNKNLNENKAKVTDKEKDFLFLIQNLKNELFTAMDMRIAQIMKNQPVPNYIPQQHQPVRPTGHMSPIIPNQWVPTQYQFTQPNLSH